MEEDHTSQSTTSDAALHLALIQITDSHNISHTHTTLTEINYHYTQIPPHACKLTHFCIPKEYVYS